MAAEREQTIDATAREPVHDAVEQVPVRIAIIDTGISTAAIAKKNLAAGHNYIHLTGSTEDTIGHGTAVASLIVGSTSAGVTGLAPDAVLVPLVYYSKTGDAQTAKGDLAMLAQSIRDAVDVYDCRIINISSGAKVDTPTLRDAVAWAEQRGALVVSCAGNDGTDTPYYPGVFPSALCVGSINATADGPAPFSNRFDGVDLLAPGIKLNTVNQKGEAVTASGTSFSTALVTASAAVLLAEDATLTPHQLRQLLTTTARDVGPKGYDIASGWGMVDLPAAMAQLHIERVNPFPFVDVPQNAHYRSAVVWALENGITGGTSATTFSPDTSCTRAQAVTFLWRAAGCPEPRITGNTFVDVKQSDYFFKAVLWAVEHGITTGTTGTTFSPDNTCNEAQIITFLWRANNRPGATGRSALAAGLGEHYYTDAVAWADTQGFFTVAQTAFSSARETSRATIATYLHHNHEQR